MATRKEVVAAARRLVGITENPPGSNRTSIGEWYGLNGYPWCAMAVSKAFADAGMPEIRFASCDAGEENFRNGTWGRLVSKSVKWLAGDVVFYGVGADSQHVGIVLSDNDDGTITTVEGNTSSGATGSQSNGGGCYVRTRRKADAWVLHAGRADFDKPRKKRRPRAKPDYLLTIVRVTERVVPGKDVDAEVKRLRDKGMLVRKEVIPAP